MKQKLLLRSLLLLCALVAGSSSVWAGDVVGTINFGSASGSTKIEGTSSSGTGPVTYTDTGKDSQDNTWTITTVTSNDKSFTQSASYSQVGAAKKPVTSITFTTTLSESQTIKAFSAKFGGFSNTAGTVTLKVGDTSVGTGSLNGTDDVTVSATDATQSGKVLTVTVTGIDKGVKCYFISYTYESSLTTTVMSFPNATYTTTLGDAFTEPVLTCNSDGTVTYSSSNTDVAEVNSSTGALTIKKAGNAVITASVPATANFTDGSASYTLKVQGVITDGVFDFAINCDYGSGAVASTTIGTTKTTWTNDKVTLAVAGRNVWYNGESLRLYKTSGDDAAGNITLSVPSGYYMTRIDLAGGTNLELTSGGGVKNKTIWSGKSQEVKFTHNEGGTITLTKITVTYCTEAEFNTKVNITMGADGYMTYCNQDVAVSFGTLEAYVVSAVGDDNVTLTPITKAPAGCAVVLKGAAGSYDLTKEETPDAVASNRLSVSYYGTITSNSSYDVYALAKKNDVVGFYKVKEGVTVPAGKCYISISKSTSAPDFLGFNGDATSIKSLENKAENGVVYDLSGRRVAQPTKGLYIMNGHKILVK